MFDTIDTLITKNCYHQLRYKEPAPLEDDSATMARCSSRTVDTVDKMSEQATDEAEPPRYVHELVMQWMFMM